MNFSGRSLLKGYINAALKRYVLIRISSLIQHYLAVVCFNVCMSLFCLREDVVHVLELEVSEEELRAGLDTQCARR